MKSRMYHPETNDIKHVSHGFSWTTLFFSCFVPLWRMDFKWFLIMFGCHLLMIFSTGFPFTQFVFPFIYNKLYIQDLLNKGYRFTDI